MAVPSPLAAVRLSSPQRAIERREGLIPSFAHLLTATAAFTLAATVAGLLIWRAGWRLDSITTTRRSDA